ncbi:DNA replication/repair protein RecF [Acetonema longum]|uniref:DNA replication and repair protein RecF n=1 Tax=Acetonema longum DSM 6540 TaxID=1009370 RepID=F7NFW0_9FIRM|nr:DNA replication/repair protein RecF [Acetonema longum]EGO65068.1 DNA replication and repair protein RecF [Acetonema longum DSM 6540]
MRIQTLTLRDFRNYSHLEIAFSPSINIMIGENAQGKTNILEAVYLGAMGQSHRAGDDEDMILWQAAAGSVDMLFVRQDLEHRVQFRLTRGQRKQIFVNQAPVKVKDLIGSFNAVLFSPEDLWLVKGSPSVRRSFLDAEISQASPVYYRHLLQYQRILLQRNNLLKSIRENGRPDQLETWDEQLAKAAAAVTLKRLAAVKRLNMLANLMHRRITAAKENLSVAYLVHGAENQEMPESTEALTQWYREKLKVMRPADIARGSTGAGPHRDDLAFSVNGKDLRLFGSQGQQRTGILAVKLAELEFIKSEAGEYPVLLLDDVMSELDLSRREHLVSFIKDRIQTFITATDATHFPKTIEGKYFYISQGTVRE